MFLHATAELGPDANSLANLLGMLGPRVSEVCKWPRYEKFTFDAEPSGEPSRFVWEPATLKGETALIHTRRARFTGVCAAAVGAISVALVAPAGPVGASTNDTYLQTNLVSDVPGRAQVTDPNLVNSWGSSHSATSALWVSDNKKDVATLYTGGIHGGPQNISQLVVNIPGGAPTGRSSTRPPRSSSTPPTAPARRPCSCSSVRAAR